MATSTISDGRGSLQRMALEIVESGKQIDYFAFSINPQQYTETMQSRTAMMQTRSALGVQRFGRGFRAIQISGNTGWGHGAGYDTFVRLKDFLENYVTMQSDDINNNYQLVLHNYTWQTHYLVEFQPNGITWSQDVNTPLLFNYSISLIEVGDAGQATPGETSDTILGNDKSSLSSEGILTNDTQATVDKSNSNTYTNPNTSKKASKRGSSTISSQLKTNQRVR